MKRNTRKVQIDMTAFLRDVEASTPMLNLVEKYGISKATIYKLKAEVSGKLARREQVPDESDADAPEAYNLTINVPTDRLDDLIGAGDIGLEELRRACMQLGPRSKAELFQEILQGRLDRALEPVAVGLQKLVSA